MAHQTIQLAKIDEQGVVLNDVAWSINSLWPIDAIGRQIGVNMDTSHGLLLDATKPGKFLLMA